MSDYCEHDGDPATCPPCNAGPIRARRSPVLGHAIVAMYPGRCAGCGDRIYEGNRIHRLDGEWVCGTCWLDVVS